MQTKKTSNRSTVQMKRLHILLNLSIKNVMKTSQHLKSCTNTWKKKQWIKKKCANDSSEEEYVKEEELVSEKVRAEKKWEYEDYYVWEIVQF